MIKYYKEMLIPIGNLNSQFHLKIRGILHVGGHHLEEKKAYNSIGVSNIVWIEGCKSIYEVAKKMFPGEKVYNEVISDVDNKEVDFIVTNNGESSSILELDHHKIEHPHIHEVRREKVKTKTLSTFFQENNINVDHYNFLNIDIQGNELPALKGLGDNLTKFDYLYLEVNTKHLYKDCALLDEINEYVGKYGFYLAKLEMTPYYWGDGFYMKKK